MTQSAHPKHTPNYEQFVFDTLKKYGLLREDSKLGTSFIIRVESLHFSNSLICVMIFRPRPWIVAFQARNYFVLWWFY